MIHKHHIIPRHAGGTDDPSNLIELTIEEHAEAHRKLYEEYGRWQDNVAWRTLSGQISKAEATKEVQRNNRNRLGIKHTGDMSRFGAHNVGRTLTKEHRAALDASRLGTKHTGDMSRFGAHKVKEYTITDPDGNTFDIVNMAKFARENNLHQGNLIAVAKGKQKQSKGYMVTYK
ncbi:MAG: HNH endonuclease [Pelagibacteraceae bacterium]|nr:HNH endonuclease [Pelagibacteraceae bacterium]